MPSVSKPDTIPTLIAEIDRIRPLIEKAGAGGNVAAEDARLAVEALDELRKRLAALAAK
jgi:hypothetical protein